jgi:hypothetical protein
MEFNWSEKSTIVHFAFVTVEDDVSTSLQVFDMSVCRYLILFLWENVIRHNDLTLPHIAPPFLSYVRLNSLI